MADNGPPFDDDELIDDYYEEDDFPQEFDDADMEEFLDDHDRGQSSSDPTPAHVNHDGGKITGVGAVEDRGLNLQVNAADNAMMDNDDEGDDLDLGLNAGVGEEHEGLDVYASARGDGIPAQVVVESLKPKAKKDLYSFDRYNGGNNWRKNSSLQNGEKDVMAAVKWKQRAGIINEKTKRNSGSHGAGTPEAQLVQFSSSTHQNSMKITPSTSNKRFVIPDVLPKENEQSVTVTLANGRMLHVRQATGLQYLRNNPSNRSLVGNKNENLLGISMQELVRRADAIERKAERKKRLKVFSSLEEQEEGDQMDDNDDADSDDEITNTNTNTAKNNMSKRYNSENDRLWVDKHAPVHFSDLLSDERINREVLRALRQWDPYIFSKEPPPRPAIFQRDGEEQKAAGKDGEGVGSSDKRPDERSRVILLSGPPGIGKTTLAHIISRHAGYRPLEVNASDERSASQLTKRVENAMGTSTLNFKKLSGEEDTMAGRPNCLILDEVDGADAKSSIAAIVNIIKAERPDGDSKKNGKKTFLRCPIIFICNHKHAPALRPLLPYARKFDVLAPSPNRLVSRLKSVLAAERMTLVGGSSILHQLVEGAGGDIRSCLHTLQFAAARAREIAMKKRQKDAFSSTGSKKSLVDITSALNMALGKNGNGLKDERGDMAGTLTAIFRKLKSKTMGNTTMRRRDVDRILAAVETFGDNSKTLDSLFVNVLNVSYVDPTLDRCWTAHEWLSCVDVFRSVKTSVASNNSSEQRTMQKWHIPSAAAAVHILCRVETRPDLTFSLRSMNDSIYQLEANIRLVDKFLESLPPLAKSGVNKDRFIFDVLPYCLSLLSAGYGNGSLTRPVSSVDVLTEEERAAFDAHVHMLRALGLTYVKEDDDEGMNNDSMPRGMRLEPEIDKISKYHGVSTSRANIPPLLKELLAHAANVAGMRENEEAIQNKDKSLEEKKVSEEVATAEKDATLEKPLANTEKPSIQEKAVSSKGKKEEKKVVKATTNFLGIGAARAKAARNARKAAKVGFVRTKGKVKMSNTGTGVPLDEVVRFKYQKGFTQAVKIPCSTCDLIGLQI